MRARDRSAQGPGFSLGGPGKTSELVEAKLLYMVGLRPYSQFHRWTRCRQAGVRREG